jgi:hypothetical protein
MLVTQPALVSDLANSACIDYYLCCGTHSYCNGENGWCYNNEVCSGINSLCAPNDVCLGFNITCYEDQNGICT